MTATDPDAFARALPKVLLHDHLDGGLREGTLVELLRARGLPAPAADAPSLARWFDQRARAGSLHEYLRGFALTVAAMATPAALERVAFEAAEDVAADGCVLAEFRVAPTLFEAHGVAAEAAVEALLAGLRHGPLPAGLIVCAIRERSAHEAVRAATLACRYRSAGVVGFDLAGAEPGHPPAEHAAALRIARDGGVPLTLHAGEADAAARVLEAARLGAVRIGHGVRLVDALHAARGATPGADQGSAAPGVADGAALLDEARARGLHLELCPSSNVHTGAVASIATHPIGALHRAGLSVSPHTDNRLMSRTTASREVAGLLRDGGVTPAELVAMQLQAARHSFLGSAQRERAAAAIRAFAREHQLAPD